MNKKELTIVGFGNSITEAIVEMPDKEKRWLNILNKQLNGTFSDISFTTWHANEQIDEYARVISDNMKLEYERFIWNMDYTFMLKNEYYNDIQTEKETDQKEVDKGIRSRNEYRLKRWELAEVKDGGMDEYTTSSTIEVVWTTEKETKSAK